MIYFVQSAQYSVTYGQFSKSFDVDHNLFETFSGEIQSFSQPNSWYLVVQLILAHEVSPLKGTPDQYTGFPTGVNNMVGRGLPRKGKISC